MRKLNIIRTGVFQACYLTKINISHKLGINMNIGQEIYNGVEVYFI